MYKILTDACRIVSILLTDLNWTLLGFSKQEDLIKFLENNLKLIKKFLKNFKALLKFSDVCFSVFHFFGDAVFSEFIKNVH